VIPKEVSQSTVVMAHATDVRLGEDEDYFASQVGNAILGASGLTSRIMSRVRTERGYAYSGSSLWTAPRRSQGIVGAITQTRSESTIAATRLLLEIIEEMVQTPPGAEEVADALDDFANGFVFNFESPSQIVSRQMIYLAEDLPQDWLSRYLEGIQAVTPASVHQVFERHVRPDQMVILIVGNPEDFDEAPEVLGPVTYLGGDHAGRRPQ